MTTVAYRSGVLAVDSLVMVNGWVVCSHMMKLRRLSDGSVCAITGNVAVAETLTAWVVSEDRNGPQPCVEDARVIVLRPNDTLEVYEDGGCYTLPACEPFFYAFGSGSPPALGAMHAGADAIRAVQCACLVDTGSGGAVLSMTVCAPEPAKVTDVDRFGGYC